MGSTPKLKYPCDARKHDEETSDNRPKEKCHPLGQMTGEATGDEKLRTEGKADQIKGDLEQAGEKVKDAFKK